MLITGIKLPSDRPRPVPVEIRARMEQHPDTLRPFMQLCVDDIVEGPLRVATFTYSSTTKPPVRFTFVGSTDAGLPTNSSFAFVDSDTTWKGDVVVLKHMIGNSKIFVDARPADILTVVQFIGACLAIEL